MSTVRLRYEKGVLRPVDPTALPLDEGQEIDVELPSGLMTDLPEMTEGELRELAVRQKEGLREICGIVKGTGPVDWSVRHDEILYGETHE